MINGIIKVSAVTPFVLCSLKEDLMMGGSDMGVYFGRGMCVWMGGLAAGWMGEWVASRRGGWNALIMDSFGLMQLIY